MSVRELNPSDFPVDPAAGVSRAANAGDGRDATTTAQRLPTIADRHYDFLWRTLRHLGVPDADAEDAVQQVLCILARRLGDIAPGAEMSFLYSTAVRVASERRRAARRRPATDPVDVDALVANLPSPEQLADDRCAREVLRAVLDAIPTDLRMVFVLFELEELTLAQIASLVGIPAGTAASRLRRARESFRAIVRRLQAEESHRERRGHP